MNTTENNKILFTSDRSGLLWFFWILALALLVFIMWLVSLMPHEEMIRSFGSVRGGRIFQAALTLVGSVFVWPMLWISGRYVERIERLENDVLKIQTWTIFGSKTKTWPESAWKNAQKKYHDGQLKLDDREVNAPWFSARPEGGKKLVIDAQGEFPDGEDALMEIIAPASFQ